MVSTAALQALLGEMERPAIATALDVTEETLGRYLSDGTMPVATGLACQALATQADGGDIYVMRLSGAQGKTALPVLGALGVTLTKIEAPA